MYSSREKTIRNKSSLSVIVLFIICAILAAATILLFLYTGSLADSLKLKEAEFAAKTAKLKDNIESLKVQIELKITALSEAEKKLVESGKMAELMKSESDKLRADFDTQRKKLLKRNAELSEKLKTTEGASLEALLAETLKKETNGDIKKVLSEALAEVELIRGSSSVNLEPIVVNGQGAGAQAPTGEIFSVVATDPKNALIAVNAGRKDGVNEGDRLTVMKGGQVAASAYVVAVRYRVASAFIDQLRRNFTIKEIKEGDEVTIAAK